jgi:hypothetical protein
MPLPPFVVFTALGSGIWTSGLVLAGYALGENWQAIIDILRRWEDIMLVALAGGVVVFVWWQLGHPGYRRTPPGTSAGPASMGGSATAGSALVGDDQVGPQR